jgi:hypothetical protein
MNSLNFELAFRTVSYLRLLLTSRDSLVTDILYCHQEEVYSMGASETRERFRKYGSIASAMGNDDLAEDFHLLVSSLMAIPLPIKLAASYMREINALSRCCVKTWTVNHSKFLILILGRKKRKKSADNFRAFF